MRHRYECPMRWADLDQLGHVNNVVYVDYLQEARVDMLRSHGRGQDDDRGGELVEGLVVVRHEVTYLRPLELESRMVSIECWVTEIRAASFTMAYEVFREGDDGRDVYLRATTVLTPFVFAEERPRRMTPDERSLLEGHLDPDGGARRREPAQAGKPSGIYPVQVRFSDVDVYGHVNNVKYYEYLQEARVVLIDQLVGDRSGFNVVVAQVDVDYLQPILFRAEPYACPSWLTHVGNRSLRFRSEIRDGDRTLARAHAVVVFFDVTTGRSVEPPAAVRERLLAAVG